MLPAQPTRTALPLPHSSRAVPIVPKTAAQVTPQGWDELFFKPGPVSD